MDNGIGSSRFIGRRSRTSRLLLGTVTSIIYLAGHAHNHQRGPSTRLTTLSRGGCSTHQFHGEDLDMPNCPKCDKPVYFAERKTSLGKDWHGSCLRCEKCNKTLTPGSHSEHEGKPYCNHPCYAALFGPGGFGRGGAESYVYKK